MKKILFILSTIGMVSWVIYIFTGNVYLRPIIGFGFGLSWGALAGEMFSEWEEK